MMLSKCVFLNSETGEDVIQQLVQSYRRSPRKSVMLSQSLEIDIRGFIGLAEPDDDTVVLLRPCHRIEKKSTSWYVALGRVAAAATVAIGIGALFH